VTKQLQQDMHVCGSHVRCRCTANHVQASKTAHVCLQVNCSKVLAQPPVPVLHAALCNRTCVCCNATWFISLADALLAFAASIQ
jgi:hypothetical protein